MKKNKFYVLLSFVIIIITLIILFGTAIINNSCSNKAVIDGKIRFEKTSGESEIIKDKYKESGNFLGEQTPKQDENLEVKEGILFSFAVFGDNGPEDGTLPQTKEFLKIIDLAKGYNPDFAFSTGDIIHGKPIDKEIIKGQFLDLLDATSVLDCKLFIAPGDHDVTNEFTGPYFTNLINKGGKSYFYFEYKDVYFIVLNANEKKRGSITGDQLIWLEDLLQKLGEDKVFIFLHPPVYSILNPECVTDNSLHIAFSDKKNQNLIRDLFNKFKVDGVFSGHEHLFNIQKILNTTYIITGCSGSNPRGPEDEGGFSGFITIDIKNESWVYKILDLSGETVQEEVISFN